MIKTARSPVECCPPLKRRSRVFAPLILNYIMMTLGAGHAMSGLALLVTGLILNWELGLVMLACVPFIGASVAVLSKLMSSSTQEGNDHYSKAGGVATEVCLLSQISLGLSSVCVVIELFRRPDSDNIFPEGLLLRVFLHSHTGCFDPSLS